MLKIVQMTKKISIFIFLTKEKLQFKKKIYF